MSQRRDLEFLIPPGLAGMRLDRALTEGLRSVIPELSRSRIQALIAAGNVDRSGREVGDPSAKVKAGENYNVSIPPPEPATPLPQKITLEILYEDKDLLVIDKPAGMVVHPAPGNRDRTLVNALLEHCAQDLSGIGGVSRPGIVHRLDKDTSGLIVVAKNDFAHQGLTRQFADRSLSRIYQAIVRGHPVPRQGTIDAPIGRNLRDRKRMAVTAKGREARTIYRTIKEIGPFSLVECQLQTGRTHQIRVHLAHKGYPVVGDPTYGKGRSSNTENGDAQGSLGRQALHAVELRFNHPRSGKRMSFKSVLPQDIKAFLRISAKN